MPFTSVSDAVLHAAAVLGRLDADHGADVDFGPIPGSVSGVAILGVQISVADGECVVEVQVDSGDDVLFVAVSELAEVLADPDLWNAKLSGATKEQFLAYLDWKRSGGGCRGTTSEGKPCRWDHSMHSDGQGPAKFVLGFSDRCGHHGGVFICPAADA